MEKYEATLEYARKCDREDSLASFRDQFHIPVKESKPVIYFCGNSLGLQPKKAEKYLNDELNAWAKYGVEAHFEGSRPWVAYHHNFKKLLSRLVGAKEDEVVAMNSVTANLHLMMVSFYRPTPQRYKILCEKDAFPSDQYALETQAKFHGYSPKEAIVEIAPEPGSELISNEVIVAKVKELGQELAVIMIGGLQYYTGQLFDMKRITEAGHSVGAVVGFDLAHAVGNVPMDLHHWDVDFAVWCSYKYLNSGPGAVGGAFVHQKHHKEELPQFGGWWGHDERERFLMRGGFKPIPSVDRWQLSNAPVFNMTAHLVSLEIFNDVGMDALRKKSLKLTGFLEYLIEKEVSESVEIITPASPEERGCQLSLSVRGGGKGLFRRLMEKGVIADWREPNVIRIAPVPLYNTFSEVFNFVMILSEEIKK